MQEVRGETRPRIPSQGSQPLYHNAPSNLSVSHFSGCLICPVAADAFFQCGNSYKVLWLIYSFLFFFRLEEPWGQGPCVFFFLIPVLQCVAQCLTQNKKYEILKRFTDRVVVVTFLPADLCCWGCIRFLPKLVWRMTLWNQHWQLLLGPKWYACECTYCMCLYVCIMISTKVTVVVSSNTRLHQKH